MNKFKKVLGRSDSIVITILYILFSGIYCYLMANGGTLYILDRFFSPYIFLHLANSLFFGEAFYILIRSPKVEKTDIFIAAAVLSVIMLIFSIFEIGDLIHSGIKDPPYNFSETLSDGTVVLLSERNDHIAGDPQSKLTYINLYRLKGFKAVKIGRIDETYFSNRCLVQDKYILDYNEETKTITVACEYGVYGNEYVHLTEEFDTGVLTYKFIIS